MPYTAPSVTGESAVIGSRTYAVESAHAIEVGLGVVVRTGNGDDGLGVTMWWTEPVFQNLFFNLGVQVSGLKVSGEAEILGMDTTGTPLDSSGSLLNSTEYVIIPDLFDSTLRFRADQTFVVRTGAPAPDWTFTVRALAAPPDQTFAVTRGPTPPDQTFSVRSITNHQVVAAEPPFMVTVFAEPADQTFVVKRGPDLPDHTFSVIRGPDIPDTTFVVKQIQVRQVRVSWAPPDVTYTVSTGPGPPPTPDQIFGVSVGGPDAPPVPTPNQTFQVKVGPEIPAQTFTVVTIDSVFQVRAGPPPFVVTVGPGEADQTFAVTVGAPPADQTFVVTTSADPADQTFDVEVIQQPFSVDVAGPPLLYFVSTVGSMSYEFNGGGFSASEDPDLTVGVGQLVTFNINANGHPFWIKDQQVTGLGEEAPTWASFIQNNGTQNGLLKIRFATAGTYYYICQLHGMMTGTITVT